MAAAGDDGDDDDGDDNDDGDDDDDNYDAMLTMRTTMMVFEILTVSKSLISREMNSTILSL